MPCREVEARYSFLSSKLIKDAAGKRPSDPDYDARTVLVPSERLGQMSGAPRSSNSAILCVLPENLCKISKCSTGVISKHMFMNNC